MKGETRYIWQFEVIARDPEVEDIVKMIEICSSSATKGDELSFRIIDNLNAWLKRGLISESKMREALSKAHPTNDQQAKLITLIHCRLDRKTDCKDTLKAIILDKAQFVVFRR